MADADGIYSLGESLSKVEEELKQIDESNWGPWKLDRSTRRVYVEQPVHYDIGISGLTGPTALFDSLRHVCEKTWANNECVGGLVRAAFAISRSSEDPVHKRD